VTPPGDVSAKPVPGKADAKVKLPGSTVFVPVNGSQNLPPGTTVDVTGNAAIQLTDPHHNQMVFSGQLGTGRPDNVPSDFIFQGIENGAVRLTLTGGNFSSSSRKVSLADTNTKNKKKKPVRRLWGSGKGKFTTKGRYASATVLGTIWEIADFTNGTQIIVKRGLVAVNDLVKHKTVLVKAGKTYFAASTKAK